MTECSCGGDPADRAGADHSHAGADCAEVIAEVWTLLDGECTAETREKLRRHLEACPGCFRHYGIEERIKSLIARKCSGEKAPDSLRERLRLEISRTIIIRG
ncbi:mycothiol system anti-sigma-R factor [Mycobacterium talmoniae]|uniref:Anti-sigma factor RshA n=1 Tax=Mycobacterium talmoniae TaxID=1858794 RepID=A0A1S1MJL7_9MYCO|nr:MULTISPECIES: mycothiol system anti-sigma-R factor [Mycobacterium]OHU83097.1 mycothiol system anti-sigma-R factor [Mycobacterium talmoniae]PQM46767.1 Anti-sigma factor RshA [Mycobacterium talmoniae]TDH53376.1 mycothiol system anti-sigma-R factor [Mycobacterium eburneum]